MKKLLLLLLAIYTISCCKKDDDQPTTNQLPPATQIGANTAGCLVNGQIFLPKGNNNFGPILSCFYQQDQDGYHFGLGIVEKGTNENKLVNLSLNPNQLIVDNIYTLGLRTNNGTNYNSNFGEYIITNNVNSGLEYRTDNLNIGEVKITKHDTQQKIISGTFWYDAILAGEKVQIREGRFDMHYVN